MSPRVPPEQLNDDALGRAVETLYADGVTERYSLMAVRAARRLGLCPTSTHLDTTSLHVDGRYHSDAEPEAQVVPITQGSSRDQRPDLTQVMLAPRVEQQAGIPILMTPLSGTSSDPPTFGQASRAPIERLPPASGATYVVADSALSREDNRAKLAPTAVQWITRGPATVSAAHAALAHADPQALAARQEG